MRMPWKFSSPGRPLAVCGMAALLLTTGCGTRVRTAAQAAQRNLPAAPTIAEPGTAGSSVGSDDSIAAPASPTGGTPGGGAPSPVTAPRPTAGPAGSAIAGRSAPIAGGTPSGTPRTEANRAPGAPGTTPGTGPAVPAPSPTRSRDPILIGNVGTYSGPVGSSTGTAPQALQVWARAVNGRGGLGGREVKVVVGDDAADPARSQALVKEFVETRKVLAFVGNLMPVTLDASVPHLEQRRVPVIGGDLTNVKWNESPVLFPQGTGVDNLSLAVGKTMVTSNVLTTGHKKVGVVYCAETPGCPHGAELIAQGAQRSGGAVVYRGQTSIAQPDYTAECLQAQQRGVEALAMILDANSISRFTGSCRRQGFTPVWMSYSLGIADRLKSIPSVEGMLAVMPTFPWTESGTPATAEYQAATRNFAPGLELGPPTSNIWTAGKLLEAGAATLSEISTAALFDGLGRLQNETLGGLTPGLTFVPGKPAPSTPCYFMMRISGGKWTAPQGTKVDCL